MTGKDLIKTIITDSQSRPIPNIWERDLKIPSNSGKIVTLCGVRRSGKTYHLFSLINTLKEDGVDSQKILYINFEDERLHLDAGSLDLILQSYRELYPDMDLSKCYFFFDEIQEIEGWEKFISRIYSSVCQNIFITGSTSKLLSKEIATTRRGRTLTFEIYPLSFSEYLKIVLPSFNIHQSEDKAKAANFLEKFMKNGGFPETIKLEKNLRDKLLQEYFNTMLFRDLVERYKIPQISILKYFCKKIVSSSGGEFSVNKIFNEIKSQGYQVSKDTLYSYQEYVESIYLCKFIPKYSYSVVKSESSKKKVYVIDQSLGISLNFKFAQDKGRILETLIGLELIKSGKQIYSYQNGGECDFIVMDKEEVLNAVQVCLDLSDPDTYKREIKGLVDACKKLNLKKGLIVTIDREDNLKVDGINIEIIPGWNYLLNI